ncbi:hypothetical protein OB919_20785 [Halobacteria archaeon AArc-curdl1]|uniref:Uncharacterized protein n=1 Tax=Natronosalvus hydrolyticus TaxID=2979988 RepID=A0AAP3E8Y1_9EURY|nr:hypothetical protein [Halobacteria archaeon AArc-curdl1]
MDKKDGLEVLALLFVFFTATIAIPGYWLFGAGAATELDNMLSFLTYGVMGAASVILIFAGGIYLDDRGFYDDHPEFAAVDFLSIHSPEQTWLGQKFPELTKPVNLFSIFLIISLILGAGISISGQFATGVPSLVEASVTDGTTLGLAVEPAVSAETLFFNVVLLMGHVAVFYYLLYTKGGLTARQSIIISKIVAVFLNTIWFYIYHSLRYATEESSQIGILILGFMLNTVTALTHSMIPAYLIHASNNLFNTATVYGVFTSETVIIIVTLGTLGASGVLWIRLMRNL